MVTYHSNCIESDNLGRLKIKTTRLLRILVHNCLVKMLLLGSLVGAGGCIIAWLALDVVHCGQALGQGWRELLHKSTPVFLTHLGLEAVENLKEYMFKIMKNEP